MFLPFAYVIGDFDGTLKGNLNLLCVCGRVCVCGCWGIWATHVFKKYSMYSDISIEVLELYLRIKYEPNEKPSVW